MASLKIMILLPIFKVTVLSATKSETAKISDHPWMVFMGGQSKVDTFCNGAIVSNFHVLTSTLCASLARTRKWTIRSGGSYDVMDEYKLDEIIPYDLEDDNRHGLHDSLDIALIRVKRPFIHGKSGQPIPFFNEKLQTDPPKIANLTGWRSLTPNDKFKDGLRVFRVSILDEEDCEVSCYDVEKEICVRELDTVGKSSGIGGLGAVLVANGTLVGIGTTHYTDPSGRKFYFFKRVAFYRDWINKRIENSIAGSVMKHMDDLLTMVTGTTFICSPLAAQQWMRDVLPGFFTRMAMNQFFFN